MRSLLIWAGFRAVTVLSVLVVVSGCTSWNTLQSGVAVQGAKAADEALETSEWGICEAVTMGAWQRRYGENPGKAKAWADLCDGQVVIP
jgi:hypothetical protein